MLMSAAGAVAPFQQLRKAILQDHLVIRSSRLNPSHILLPPSLEMLWYQQPYTLTRLPRRQLERVWLL